LFQFLRNNYFYVLMLRTLKSVVCFSHNIFAFHCPTHVDDGTLCMFLFFFYEITIFLLEVWLCCLYMYDNVT
jgi:hypothetical protein